MRIAIHAADLDHDRIDGTRVYIYNMLKNFGEISKDDEFLIYHKSEFNPHLAPPVFPNYKIKKLYFPKFWTQTRFALELFLDKPDVLLMPMHNVPMLRPSKTKVVVTIHDLAFKTFPQYFPKNELRKLNCLTDHAIKNADKIIAISHDTKKDILKFYPQVHEKNVSVIYHGFDAELFENFNLKHSMKVLEKYQLEKQQYLLYVGAIQPRKNLETLIEAFEKIKIEHPKMKLVFAGAPAWRYEQTLKKIADSKFSKDITVTGTLAFSDIVCMFKNASIFVFPPLKEGFGIPVLEAFACEVPVVLADNSALLEVGKDAALFFKTGDSDDLTGKIQSILGSPVLRDELVKKGLRRAKDFSWQKCAKLTLDNLMKW